MRVGSEACEDPHNERGHVHTGRTASEHPGRRAARMPQFGKKFAPLVEVVLHRVTPRANTTTVLAFDQRMMHDILDSPRLRDILTPPGSINLHLLFHLGQESKTSGIWECSRSGSGR